MNIYCTCAIITCTSYPFSHFLRSKNVFSRGFCLKILVLCMVGIQERFLIKSKSIMLQIASYVAKIKIKISIYMKIGIPTSKMSSHHCTSVAQQLATTIMRRYATVLTVHLVSFSFFFTNSMSIIVKLGQKNWGNSTLSPILIAIYFTYPLQVSCAYLHTSM